MALMEGILDLSVIDFLALAKLKMNLAERPYKIALIYPGNDQRQIL
jgi:hypothetical protein